MSTKESIKYSTDSSVSVIRLIKQIIASTYSQAPVLKSCLLLMIASNIAYGLALASLFPLFKACLASAWLGVFAWCAVFTLLSVCAMVLRWYAMDYDYKGYMVDSSFQLREALGQKLRTIPILELYQLRKGSLNTVLSANVDYASNYTMTIMGLMISAVVPALTLTVVLWFIDWRMALILSLVFPIVWWRFYQRSAKVNLGMQVLLNTLAEMDSELIEYIKGLPVLKNANLTGVKHVKLQQAFATLQMVQEMGHQKSSKPTLMTQSIVDILLLVFLSFGVMWILSGSLEVSALAAIFVAIVRFSEPLKSIASMMNVLILLQVSMNRIQDLFDIPDLSTARATKTLPQEHHISFQDVTFSYGNSSTPALKTINLGIPSHSMTALVGASGSGKTTLTRLIMRWADPQRGAVLIGGIDIRELFPEDLMHMVSCVFQEVGLFNDTIMNNILMGKSGATEEEVYEVAKRAYCHDFILRLPKGYQTTIGDVGRQLSGGEKQRISIARALLKDAPIVILDEPTSSLDAESERAVQKAIDELVKDKTLIVIAHRLTTIAGADQIIVFDNGEIIEQGDFAALMAIEKGVFKHLWDIQNQHIQ